MSTATAPHGRLFSENAAQASNEATVASAPSPGIQQKARRLAGGPLPLAHSSTTATAPSAVSLPHSYRAGPKTAGSTFPTVVNLPDADCGV